nr:MAG: hypothetical protein [Lokiarchaeota virus Ratatoskr Meg22_1012]
MKCNECFYWRYLEEDIGFCEYHQVECQCDAVACSDFEEIDI